MRSKTGILLRRIARHQYRTPKNSVAIPNQKGIAPRIKKMTPETTATPNEAMYAVLLASDPEDTGLRFAFTSLNASSGASSISLIIKAKQIAKILAASTNTSRGIDHQERCAPETNTPN